MFDYIDVHSHCFYGLERGFYDYDRLIKEAINNNLLFIENGLDFRTNQIIIDTINRHYERGVENLKGALGLYPINAIKLNNHELDKIERQIKNHIQKFSDRFIAVGEIGLDYKYDLEQHEKQQNIFSKIMKLAKKLSRPIIVHSRKAEKDVISLIEDLGYNKVIVHCFSGNKNLVKRIINNNWYLSITAAINKSSNMKNIVKLTPLSQLLTETDSPFLSPDNNPNRPLNVKIAVQAIATIKKIGVRETKEQIKKNFINLFF